MVGQKCTNVPTSKTLQVPIIYILSKMRLDVRQTQKGLLLEMGKRIQLHGFPPKPRGQAFRRKTDFGSQVFHLSFATRGEAFDVSADVAVRFDAVEALVNEENALLTSSEKRATATLGVELGNFHTGHRRMWENICEDEVCTVANSMFGYFADVGLPYLAQYSDMEAAFSVLNRDDREGWLHLPIHAERAKRAIAMVYLMHGIDRAEQLALDKINELQSLDAAAILPIQRLVKQLQRASVTRDT